MKPRIISLILTLLILSFPVIVRAGERKTGDKPTDSLYRNNRFAFSIRIPNSWNKFKNPPPANNDGISFNLPHKATFSASGINNVLENSLEQEIKERIGTGTIISKTNTKIGNKKAIQVLYENNGIMNLLLCTINEETDVIYSVYYTAPKSTFNRYRVQAQNSIATFKIE